MSSANGMTVMGVGKFTFVWKFTQLEDGRPAPVLIDEAVWLGLGMVAIKIADGAAYFDSSGTDTQMRYYVQELHRRGIQVWGWHYLYGGRRLVRNEAGAIVGSAENLYSTPEREAEVAVARVRAFGLDGYIMDPEAEYKTAPDGRAFRFVNIVRAGLGSSIPFALCSYRYPVFHQELPWGEFLTQTNYHMPQVYWGEGPRNDGLLPDGRYLSVVELEASVSQLRELRDLPFLPVGRAYIGDGHSNPRPAEIVAFLNRAYTFGFEGAGLWNWDSLRPSYPGAPARAAAISAFQFPTTRPVHRIFIPRVTR